MADRITRKQVETAFQYFVEELAPPDPENWQLDFNSIYGGYQITQRITYSTGTGEHSPLGYGRRKATEMYYTLHFATDALRVAKQFKKEG
jgi:hypothetical protein